MRTLNTAMSSDRLLMSGANHLTALNQTEATKPLIGAFQPAHEALQTAVAARAQAEAAMGVPRITLRFTEKDLERVIREIALLAHTVDDNAITGPAFKALFPDGLDAEVRPLGLSQIAATTALRERLATQPAAAKVKAQAMEGLDQALARFKATLEGRQSAEGKLSQARAVESGAREAFVKAPKSPDRG